MKIVSLVPNATEIVFALGLGNFLIGRSHECDYPADAAALPILTGSALSSDLGLGEVDQAVSDQLASGESLYTLDEEKLQELSPELILTQELCPVCAVSTAQVSGAVEPLPYCPEVLTVDPKTLAEVFACIKTVAEHLGHPDRGVALVASLERRLEEVSNKAAGRARPTVAALEWIEPPFLAGHWVPEMVEIAGGRNLSGAPGDPSKRCSTSELAALDPDILVFMPCGFDEDGAALQIEQVREQPAWQALRAIQNERAFPVDANGCFSRPGPRLVDGIETLVGLFHPLEGR